MNSDHRNTILSINPFCLSPSSTFFAIVLGSYVIIMQAIPRRKNIKPAME
jgi:hypothetical protein